MALQTAQEASAAHVQMLISRQEASNEHDCVQVRATAQELQITVAHLCDSAKSWQSRTKMYYAACACVFIYVLLICRQR